MHNHNRYSPTATRISHQGSAGASHEFKESISVNLPEQRLADALRLAMANLFLTKPYDLCELFDVLQIIKKSDNFSASSVRQDIATAPPGRPYKMTIHFRENKSRIQVSVHTSEETLRAETSTKKRKYKETIEMIQYLEEEYINL